MHGWRDREDRMIRGRGTGIMGTGFAIHDIGRWQIDLRGWWVVVVG